MIPPWPDVTTFCLCRRVPSFRACSNSKGDYYKAMPWFWEHADRAGYTLWLQKYKYNNGEYPAGLGFNKSRKIGGAIIILPSCVCYLQSLPSCASSFSVCAENKKDFMTSNLVGGFIQRSEEMRKYAFGLMHVLNNSVSFDAANLCYCCCC